MHRAADIPALAGAFDGINIKLMKCGGIAEALRMIAVARAHGMKVMLGCMIESSVAITAAAHISPLVDTADLDGNLLLETDPYVGATVVAGRIVLPEGPGLGVKPRADWTPRPTAAARRAAARAASRNRCPAGAAEPRRPPVLTSQQRQTEACYSYRNASIGSSSAAFLAG